MYTLPSGHNCSLFFSAERSFTRRPFPSSTVSTEFCECSSLSCLSRYRAVDVYLKNVRGRFPSWVSFECSELFECVRWNEGLNNHRKRSFYQQSKELQNWTSRLDVSHSKKWRGDNIIILSFRCFQLLAIRVEHKTQFKIWTRYEDRVWTLSTERENSSPQCSPLSQLSKLNCWWRVCVKQTRTSRLLEWVQNIYDVDQYRSTYSIGFCANRHRKI